VFVEGKSLLPSLKFVGEAGGYPIEEPFSCHTLGNVPGLAHKQ